MEFGNVLLKAIMNNHWVRIEYENSNSVVKEFMIGINRIDPKLERLSCEEFNTDEEKGGYLSGCTIYYNKIKNATVLEDTYHKTPEALLTYILENKEQIAFLRNDVSKDDILDYYIDCFKMDTVPYIGKYGLIEGIDGDVLQEPSFHLNENQFKKLLNQSFFKKEKKQKNETRIERNYVLNEVSIVTPKGLYVLAYRELKLDIANKALVPDTEVSINKEFLYDSSIDRVQSKESIARYISEEDYTLLEDFTSNKDKIIEAIHEYNNTRTAAYCAEVKIDSRPFIVCLEKNFSLNIENEINNIKALLHSGEEIPLPIRTFFGDPESRLKRRQNYPLFTVDKYYNIDQINAINIGLKSPASYIQGPPGTGKTKTLLNAIFTAVFNGQTVLVTSNNNIPMDGVYKDILDLKYKNKTELLFPAIRLGSQDKVAEAILRMKEMYERSLSLKAFEDKIKEIKKKRSEAMQGLVELLAKYEKHTELTERLASAKVLKSKCDNASVLIGIEANITALENAIEELGNVNVDDFEKYMNIDYNELFMAIHFETAGRLQKLKSAKYKELYDILFDATIENAKEKAKDLKTYLSTPENLATFQRLFPVIISTNLSCTYLGKVGPMFDIVMMDEAGQCSIANALLPISRGSKLMLVGDPQQLKPVIVLDSNVNKKLRNKYHVPDEYDYIDNSIYTTYTKVDVVNNETLLRSHYRCNNKIIGFNNKKYYNNKLKLLSESKEEHPLFFFDTSKDEVKNKNTMKNVSDVEAKAIVKYIKNHPNEKIGIITPFVRQKMCIEAYLEDHHIEDISVGTVHAFQGDQKDVILFSTAITNTTSLPTYAWLKNNRELINVAISRAKDKLVVLANKEALMTLSDGKDDMSELIQYVESEGNSEVTNVSPESIALGTRHISTESEKELSLTINHVLSVINPQCYIKNEVAVSSIFTEDSACSSLFYMQRFDIVLFEKRFSEDVVLLAIEENGPEHYTDEEVIRRDKKKKEFCDRHHLTLLSIPRDCARDYGMIKNELLKIVSVKK